MMDENAACLKVCCNCNRGFPFAEFWQTRGKLRGYSRRRCKSCNRVFMRGLKLDWMRRNPEKAKAGAVASVRAWQKRNPEAVKRINATYRTKNAATVQRRHREGQVKQYGLSLAEYEAMRARQAGKCAVLWRKRQKDSI